MKMNLLYNKNLRAKARDGWWRNTRCKTIGSGLLLLTALLFGPILHGQVNFTPSGLSGESLNNPTSLQFGPDGRLYVSQQNGLIYAFTIVRNGPNDYDVVGTESIGLIQDIQNHNDDGTPSGTNNRQVTGILVTGTGANPIVYVSSSDPRIGAGGGGVDKVLDTNSGVVSCLECVGGIDENGECTQWKKVDLVRGLPRSEENHSVNGMQLDENTNTLYLAVGGFTNAGAPSNNFAFTVEYTFSSVIVAIDLDAIDALPEQTDPIGGDIFKYDLPTLDDPTRPNLPDGSDPGDPFGGNDGLNMAKYDPNGPVQIHSFGWRNLYDIVITENGRMYGVDNGANGNWGGHPDGEQDYPAETTVGTATNNWISGEPGSNGPGPGGDDKVNNLNGLHYIRPLEPGEFNYVDESGQWYDGLYYGGHPHPIWANPTGAGLYTKGSDEPGDDHTVGQIWRTQVVLDANGDPVPGESLPVDWPPVPPQFAYPPATDFRNSGQDDNAIANYGPSTNGIAEYTASNFNNALKGNLLLASFNGNIYQVSLSEDGKVALNCPTPPENGSSTVSNCQGSDDSFASGFGSTPLDVIAQGDNDPFGGTVWAATYGSDNITIFEPADYNGNDPIACEGTDDDTIDEDGDGYTNADEIQNGTNPCSGASQPNDFDDAIEFNGFKRSNLLDNDDDNDGLADAIDPFQLDPTNGKNNNGELPFARELFNATGFGIGDIGFTGVMVNGTNDYLELIDDVGDELVFGGTAGIYTDPTVTDGDAFEDTNTQKNGFQFGVAVNTQTGPFTIEAQINGPFLGDVLENFASHGIQMGTGDQDNYLKVVLSNQNGSEAIQVLYEENGAVASDQKLTVPAAVFDATAIRLFLSVDPTVGTVQARYSADGGPITDIGNPVTLTGNVLAAVQGTYTINGQSSCLAVGPIATSFGDNAPEFGASWDYFRIDQDPSEETAIVSVNTGGLNGSTFGGSSFVIENTSSNGAEITKVTFDLSSAMIKEVVFDPDGTAGDATAKGFDPNNGTENTTGVTGHTFTNPYEGGFYGLEVDFNDFNPGETLEFAVDIDPISIKGGSSPGPNQSGSVSGLELTGSRVSVTYDDGSVQEVDLFRTPNSDGNATSIVRTQLPPQPVVTMNGVDNMSTVFQDEQTVAVNVGVDQVEVRLLQLEAGLFVEDLSGPFAGVGYDIDPFEVNSVIVVDEQTATTDTDGSVSFDVTLTDSDPEAGYNLFAAVVVDDQDGATGLMSNVFIVAYDPDAQPTTLYRINTAQETLPASDGGPDWEGAGGSGAQSGDGWSVNTGNISTHNISGRDASVPDYVPQALFAKERWDPPAAPPMTWNFDVSNGMYQVRLYMGNGFGGTSQPGQRVFGIQIEGEVVETGLDLSNEFGHQVGTMKEYVVNVNDGDLEVGFISDVENPTLNGIEILAFDVEEDPNAITLAPISNQSNEEGDDIGNSGLAVSAMGGDGNLNYQASGLPQGVQLEPTNGQFFGVIAEGAAGDYMVTLTVDDSDNDPTDVQTIMFNWNVTAPLPEPIPGTVLYRVNAGGPQVMAADNSAPDWGQDQGNIGAAGNSPYLADVSPNTSVYTQAAGSAYKGPITRSASVPAAVPDDVFTSERFDLSANAPALTYSFPIEAGTQVQVDLHFLELFDGVTAAGERVFDVLIEGQVVLNDFDQFAEAGGELIAITRTFNATVGQDGSLDIVFDHVTENPAVKGIEVRAATSEVPFITPIMDKTFAVLGEFGSGRFVIEAEDQQDDPFTLTATGLPAGLSLQGNEIVGTIQPAALTGGDNNDGVHTVTITATEDNNPDNTSTETFTITVVDRSLTITAPQDGATVPTSGFEVEWMSTGGATDVFEHIHVVLVGPFDENGDPQLYSDDGSTRFGSLPLNGSVSIPGGPYTDLPEGEYEVIAKWAYPSHVEMDEAIAIPDVITITVEEAVNAAPVVTNPGTQENAEGDMILLPINATDEEDCGQLTYSATGLPGGLTIDEATGVISGTITEGTTGEVEEGAWIEENGLVVIEMESADNLPGAWQDINSYSASFSPDVNSPTGATGDNFIIWQSGQNLGNPGVGTITYPVQINNAGTYQFKWRNQVGNGTNTTEHNDTWLKIDADQFFGSKNNGGSTVCPNGAPSGTCPAGSSSPNGSSNGGWFKIYSSGANNWSWSTNTSDNDAHQIFATFDQPGIYNIQISARSNSHAVDRMVLVNESLASNNGQSLSLAESTRTQADPGEPGASANSPYTVNVTVADNCQPSLETSETFTWNVLPADDVPGATITVNAGGGLGSSTFGNNSFIISNTGSADIVNVTIDASRAFLPDVVFDPVGTAGDNGAKCLTAGSAGDSPAAVGITVPANGGSDVADCESVFAQPHNGIDNDEGYDVLTLDFTDFNPDESFAFGVDMDPTSIKGDLSTGDAGSISGFELIGTTVTITFSDGRVLTASLFDEGSLGGSDAEINLATNQTAPSISLEGLGTPTTTNDPNQTILIEGIPGQVVTLMQVDARLYIDPGNPSIGYDVDPFEANEAMAKQLYTATLGQDGKASIPVTLLQTPGSGSSPDGGLNHFMAVIGTADGTNGPISNTVVVAYDPNFNPEANLALTIDVPPFNDGENPNTVDKTGMDLIQFYPVGQTENPTYTFDQMSDADGLHNLTNLVPGVYTVFVQRDGFYLSEVEEITLVGGANTATIQLRAGDSNESNKVDIFDFSFFASKFGLNTGQTGFDPAADYDLNGNIGLLDFSILAFYFDQEGEQIDDEAIQPLSVVTKDPVDLSLLTRRERYLPGDQIAIDLYLQADAQAISGVQTALAYDTEMLEYSHLEWTGELDIVLNEKADVDNGLVYLSGGSLRTTASGLVRIATFYFQAREAGMTQVRFADSKEQLATYAGDDLLRHTYDIDLTIEGQLTNAQDLLNAEPVVRLFPIPSNGMINLEVANMPLNLDYTVEVFSADGRLILTKDYRGEAEDRIDLSNQPSGMYNLKLTSETHTINKAFSIQQ